MVNQYGYQQYKQQSINTMTKGELLVLLYDEILKRLARAEMALKQQDYELFDQSVIRAKEIIMYLIDTLDNSYEISREILRFYRFFITELARLEAGRNPQIIHDLKPLIMELRGAFKEADILSTANK